MAIPERLPPLLRSFSRTISAFSGFFRLTPEIEIGRVGVIVHGENLLDDSPPREILHLVEDEIQDPARFFVGDVVLDAGAPRIDEVIKTGPVDSFLFHQVENGRNLVCVVPVDRKAQAHLLTLAQTIPDAPQGPVEGSLFAAEPVVNSPTPSRLMPT